MGWEILGAVADEIPAAPLPRQARTHRGGTTEAPARPAFGRVAVRAVEFLGSMPLPTARRLGAFVGAAAAVLPGRSSRTARVNLDIAFPELDPRVRRALRLRSLVQSGRTFAEVGAWWTWDLARIEREVVEVAGECHLRDPLAAGRGAILAAPHLGSWELLGMWASARWPMTTLYREPRVREIDRFFRESRGRVGATLVPAGLHAARTLIRALRRGELVGILPDQDTGVGAGVFVPYFGKLANTMTLIHGLARASAAVVVLGWAERLPDDRGHVLHFVPASQEVYDPDPAVSAAALNRDVERLVRSCPEQYLWTYRRWRVRPPGERDPYR